MKNPSFFKFIFIFCIFISMGNEGIQHNLKRRMWRNDGVYYFCRICGDYLREDNFYKSKTGPFKLDTKCKIHYTKKDIDDDGEMDYLKLNRIQDEDFKGTQMLLESLGYKFGADTPSVHIQFLKRHNLEK